MDLGESINTPASLQALHEKLMRRQIRGTNAESPVRRGLGFGQAAPSGSRDGSQALAQEPQAGAAGNAEELTRAAQNPIAAMINIPFQNNMNFGYGPNDHIQNVLTMQPFVNYNFASSPGTYMSL